MVVVLSSIGTACKQIASYVARAGIAGMTGLAGAANIQGEDQKKLDVIANDVFCNALKDSGRTAVIASEEEDVPVAVEETFSGNYVVVFDPLDGSSNIDAAVSTGSIFGIYEPTTTCITQSAGGTAGQVQARAAPGCRWSLAFVSGRHGRRPRRRARLPPAGELHCQRVPAGQQPARGRVLHVQLVRDHGAHYRQGGARRRQPLAAAEERPVLRLTSGSDLFGRERSPVPTRGGRRNADLYSSTVLRRAWRVTPFTATPFIYNSSRQCLAAAQHSLWPQRVI